MMKKMMALVCGVMAWVVAQPALAAEDRGFWAVYGGVANVMRDDKSVQIGAEYRFKPLHNFYHVRPIAGVNVDNDGAVYGYGGIAYDYALGGGYVVTPNFAAGFYERGDSYDLGGEINFRSGVEVTKALAGSARIGLAFNHVSNAGIYDENPGLENLLLVYRLSY